MNRRRIGAAVVVLLCTPLIAANCGANDAPVKTRDKSGASVMNMPNHFSSVAIKCDGFGHVIYENDHGDSGNGRGVITIVQDSRHCPDGYRGVPR
jgi:hypothetical protein